MRSFVPRGRMPLVAAEATLATHTFRTHHSQHHFCPTCGCAPFGKGTRPKGEYMAAINVRCLDGIDIATVTIAPFDGRSV